MLLLLPVVAGVEVTAFSSGVGGREDPVGEGGTRGKVFNGKFEGQEMKQLPTCIILCCQSGCGHSSCDFEVLQKTFSLSQFTTTKLSRYNIT